MKISAEFKDVTCYVIITAEDEWEQKLLGAVAKGEETLSAFVTYKPEGHFSYGKCNSVQIRLESANKQKDPY